MLSTFKNFDFSNKIQQNPYINQRYPNAHGVPFFINEMNRKFAIFIRKYREHIFFEVFIINIILKI